MELNQASRWGLGSRSSGARLHQEERKQLLHLSDQDEDDDDDDDDEVDGRKEMKRASKSAGRMKKAKEKDDHDGADEALLLLPLSRPPKPPPVAYQCFEVDIQPSDTLTSLSLKYNLPVAELKRVNNILNENEFFALKRVKILVRPDSLLTELLPGQSPRVRSENGWTFQESADVMSSAGQSGVNSEAESCSQGEVDPVPASKQVKKARSFLRSVDKDLERIKISQERMSSSSLSSSAGQEETVSLEGWSLPQPQPQSQLQSPGWSTASFHGAAPTEKVSKCGLACLAIVILAVVIILLIAKHETYELSLAHHHWTMKSMPPPPHSQDINNINNNNNNHSS